MAEPEAFRSDTARDEEREPFGAFVADQTTRDAVIALTDRFGWSPDSVQHGGLDGALRTLGVMSPPRLVIVETTGTGEEEALDGIREIARAGTIVIAIGERDDGELFKYMLSAGAADYLVKPIDEASLERAVMRAQTLLQNTSGGKQGRRGRVVAVIGARGGVGSSTIAGNLAWVYAEKLRRRVMLVDFDLQFGTIAFAFDLQPSHGLREALEDPERIDEVFVDRASQAIDERLRVLADEEAIDQPPDSKAGAAASLIDTLADTYDLTVLDMPRSLLAADSELAEHMTNVLLVGNLSLAGLRDTNRLAAMLQNQNPDLRVAIAINQMNRNGPNELSRQDFEKHLQVPLLGQIPYDPKSAMKAMRAGEPIGKVAPGSSALRELTRLAAKMIGAAGTQKRSLLARLLRRSA